MSDDLDAVAAEADHEPDTPVYETVMHGYTWRFGQPDIRPAALRRYKALADKVTRGGTALSQNDAVELSATAEDMLKSALPDAQARGDFDTAPFSGSEIADLCREYFDKLGATVGESSASAEPSPSTVARSRRTSKLNTASG